MQTVKRSWLLMLNWGFIVLGLICLFSYIIFAKLGLSPSIAHQWGLTPIVIGICLLQIIYGIVIYPWLCRRSPWAATMISIIIYAVFFTAIIEASNRNNYVIRAGYVAFIFLIAMTGALPTMAGVTITWALYIFVLIGAIPSTTEEIITTGIINIFVTFAGVLGWLVFRKYYIDAESKKTARLSRLLQQEQFKSTVILESITDGVLVLNTKGTILIINTSAALMLGWDQKDALHLDYRSIIVPFQEKGSNDPTSEESAITICASTQQATQKISLLTTKNQRHMHVDITASPILEGGTDDAGNKVNECVGIIAVLRNVDEQKREEEQRSDFISTASHEMRTPVAAIQGFIELALNTKVATIDAKAREYLEKAHEATKHLGLLFQDLLTVSRSEDGRLTNNPKLIEVGEFLTEIVEQSSVTAQKKGLKLVSDGMRSTDKTIAPLLYVHVDAEKLREVVLNLLDNAIKYTSSGIITIGTSLKERSVIIRVSDTGMGIASEDLPHLFQKFYRTDNSETREIGGSGLGLYICQQIVDMMAGKIWVESTVGAGSTFYVELPRISPEKVAALSLTANLPTPTPTP